MIYNIMTTSRKDVLYCDAAFIDHLSFIISLCMQVTTRLVYKSGTLTWTLFAILCCFCGLCIALIPFCVDGTKDVYHINPVNGTVVGVYKRRCC